MKKLLTILLIAVSCCGYGQGKEDTIYVTGNYRLNNKWVSQSDFYKAIKDTAKFKLESKSMLYAANDSSYKRMSFNILSNHELFAQIKNNSDTFEINPNAKYYYGVRIRYIKVGNTVIKLND